MHRPTTTKTVVSILSLASLALVARGLTGDLHRNPKDPSSTNLRSIPNHPASPDPAIPEPIGINERWDQPLTYYVIDDTCPASRPVVEIRQRSARRLVRSPDSKQRAHLLAGVNRLLRESLARVTGIDPAPRRSTSGSS